MTIPNQDIHKENRGYLVIFGGLLLLTGASLVIHFMHFPTVMSVLLILAVALTQAGLSACYFMHLISERKLIYLVLALTFVFFATMILLICAGQAIKPEGTLFVS